MFGVVAVYDDAKESNPKVELTKVLAVRRVHEARLSGRKPLIKGLTGEQ